MQTSVVDVVETDEEMMFGIAPETDCNDLGGLPSGERFLPRMKLTKNH